MSCDDCGDSEGCVWEHSDCILGKNAGAEIPRSLTMALNQKRDHFSCMFDDATTPLKACGDLPYHLSCNEIRGKELYQYGEPYSQAKRCRALYFVSDFPDSTLCNDDMHLRSKETTDSFDNDIFEISQRAAGFTENTIPCSDELLGPSCEGWIAECFNLNDTEVQCSAEDMIAGVSDVQIDTTDLCTSTVKYKSNAVEKLPIHTHRNSILQGKKSKTHTPLKLGSSIVCPFTFIKPCCANGDMTLNDINQRLHTPKQKKTVEQDDSLLCYPTSVFSGKPVLGKTEIRTENGEGSITILRTKG